MKHLQLLCCPLWLLEEPGPGSRLEGVYLSLQLGVIISEQTRVGVLQLRQFLPAGKKFKLINIILLDGVSAAIIMHFLHGEIN